MRPFYGLYLLIFTLISCKPSAPASDQTQETQTDTSVTEILPVPGLNLLWETDQKLTTAESLLYDKANNILYVSCINGVPPDKKDNDGFIARVTTDGKIQDQKWVTGLSAPKGMGLSGSTLYVTDIDRLVAIDITSGKIANTWKVDGASFLNDVYITDDGRIYFSDSNTNTIHSLSDGKVSTIKSDTLFGGANGIMVEGDIMYVAGYIKGKFCRMNLTTKNVELITSEIPGGDGVEKYGDAMIVSNWNGQVYHIAADQAVTMLMDSQDAKLNAADIEIIPEKDLLLVPTFFGNNVMAYQLVKN
jgi:hypothetical protein